MKTPWSSDSAEVLKIKLQAVEKHRMRLEHREFPSLWTAFAESLPKLDPFWPNPGVGEVEFPRGEWKDLAPARRRHLARCRKIVAVLGESRRRSLDGTGPNFARTLKAALLKAPITVATDLLFLVENDLDRGEHDREKATKSLEQELIRTFDQQTAWYSLPITYDASGVRAAVAELMRLYLLPTDACVKLLLDALSRSSRTSPSIRRRLPPDENAILCNLIREVDQQNPGASINELIAILKAHRKINTLGFVEKINRDKVYEARDKRDKNVD